MKKIFLFLFLISIPYFLFSQKIEIEKRITKDKFPENSLLYLKEKFPNTKKVRYFMERNADTVHYEAKFKYDNYCYSVEFFNNGELEDIEKKIKKNELPNNTKNNIEEYLNSIFQKHKIQKTQEQTGHGKIRYELIVNGKDQSGINIYEFLFTEKGDFLQKLKIILPSNNITLY